jgi:hypothetical protein
MGNSIDLTSCFVYSHVQKRRRIRVAVEGGRVVFAVRRGDGERDVAHRQ